MAIFISVPITGRDIDDVRKEVDAIVKANPQVDYITPFDMKNWELGKSWEWYMARDLKLIEGCSAIMFCDGWQDSRGCRMEHAWAEYLNITIVKP